MTRILAHIHTMNDENVIGDSLAAVLNQTRPVDDVLIVDNGSVDGTLDREFPDNVTCIEHGCNLGTSGSVITGLKYALERQYDWLWVFDADAAPRPDALSKLFEYYETLSADEQDQIHRITSLSIDLSTGQEVHGFAIGKYGFGPTTPPADGRPYECVGTIWSGSLFRLDNVRKVGLPDADYVLDAGETVYGYEAKIRGFRTMLVPASIVDHNIDTEIGSALQYRRVSFGPLKFGIVELAPIRHYYRTRNLLHFWLHEYRDRSLAHSLRMLPGWVWIPSIVLKLSLLGRWAEARAILRGLVDGLLGRMQVRF